MYRILWSALNTLHSQPLGNFVNVYMVILVVLQQCITAMWLYPLAAPYMQKLRKPPVEKGLCRAGKWLHCSYMGFHSTNKPQKQDTKEKQLTWSDECRDRSRCHVSRSNLSVGSHRNYVLSSHLQVTWCSETSGQVSGVQSSHRL